MGPPGELRHPSPAAGDAFGRAVDVDGDTIVVGALADDVLIGDNKGSAQVYSRSGTTWSHQASLMYPDPLGLAALTAGRHGVAVEHVERALERHERMGSPPLIAPTRSRLAAARGETRSATWAESATGPGSATPTRSSRG